VNQASRLWAVVPAAGVGRRMGGEVPKQYLMLGEKPVIVHTLERLLSYPRISGVVVALSPEDEYWASTGFENEPRIHRAQGGRERCHSVLNGLEVLATLAAPSDWVLVHDAARPCLRDEDLDRLITELETDPVGGILAVPVHDTVKQSDEDGRISTTVPRESLWRAYTPQMFRFSLLKQAIERALAQGIVVTDEASAVEAWGESPRLVEGHADNIKITRPEDLELAAFFLQQQRARN
jgi:2-C-methyl-D-erythritol 4-phosphate cytidylyltransferase